MREQLLGYLMGALDAAQQIEVEQALERDSVLRQELDLLNQALDPLRVDRGLHEPPAGLSERTLDAVAAVAGWPEEIAPPAEETAAQESDANAADLNVALPAARRASELSSACERVDRSWAERWAAVDVVASAAILAAAAVLFFPAIVNSRFQARILACQSNLQTLAKGLENYSENHQQQFIPVPAEGRLSFAGIYAPTLHDYGYAPEARSFYCPGQAGCETKGEASSQPQAQCIPTIGQIERAVGEELRRLKDLAGGSYGYNLGYWENGLLSAPRNSRSPTLAILADAPGSQRMGLASVNHEGRGQNVLFGDFHCRFFPDGRVGCDEIYYSDRDVVEAGRSPQDAVIGSSHSPPLPFDGK